MAIPSLISTAILDIENYECVCVKLDGNYGSSGTEEPGPAGESILYLYTASTQVR